MPRDAASACVYRRRLPPSWHAFAFRFALSLMLVAPGLAHPQSLPQLLRMPLERLLQLEISPPHAAVNGASTADLRMRRPHAA